MKIYRLLIVLMVLLALTNGCKKDKEKTKTELLTQHTWIVKTATVDPSIPITNNQGIIIGYTNDIWSQIEECEKDDTGKYSSDGTVKYDEGASRCDSSDPQTRVYDWTFNSDETVITESNGQGYIQSYFLLFIDENSMTQSVTQKIENNNYTITITLEPV